MDHLIYYIYNLTLNQRFPKWAILPLRGDRAIEGGAMKVTSLINLLLITYAPIHFFYGRGVCHFLFLQMGGKDKRFGNHCLKPNISLSDQVYLFHMWIVIAYIIDTWRLRVISLSLSLSLCIMYKWG